MFAINMQDSPYKQEDPDEVDAGGSRTPKGTEIKTALGRKIAQLGVAGVSTLLRREPRAWHVAKGASAQALALAVAVHRVWAWP